jgi:hypothetical protein
MNKKSIAILCLTALYSILFYHQHVGINFVLFTIATISFLIFTEKDSIKSKSVILLSLGALFSSVFAFVHDSNLSMWTTFIALAILPGAVNNKRASIIIDLGTTIYNIFIAPAFMFINAAQSSKKTNENTFLKLLKYLVPLVLIIMFFFIYRAMNPLFENFTQEIAEVISIGWVFFTLGGLVLVYALFKQRRNSTLDEWERNWNLTLNSETLNPPKWSEAGAFSILFVVLNLMLMAVNAMDVNYLYMGTGMPEGITHKEFVHKGVGMLILSIVLGISILLFFFRDYLNFAKQRNLLKLLAILWVAQNTFMVFSTAIRNTMYVDAALLTYKRIGVYFWLFFALLGLITLFIKLYKNKSVWYLARYNFSILYIVLLMSSAFDWDMVISDFNISRAKQMDEISSLDKNYLLSISEGNISKLYEIKDIEGFEVDSVYSYNWYGYSGGYHETNSNSLDAKVYKFLLEDAVGDWRSYSLRRDKVRADIQQLDKEGRLSSMELQNTYLRTLKPLTGLVNLNELNLSGNSLSNPEFISELNLLSNLKKLYLDRNYIYELDSLVENKNLTHLSLAENNLNNLEFIKNFPNLDSLVLSANQLISLASLPKTSRISSLNLDGNPLTNVEQLSKIKGLKELNLGNVTTRINNMPEMADLEILNLYGSKHIVSRGLVSAPSYPKLKSLNISNTELSNIHHLIKKNGIVIAPKLEELIMAYNNIGSLYGISAFKDLRILQANGNSIYSLEGIQGLTYLEELNLNSCKISDITALKNLNNLRELNLSYNSGVVDFSPLKALPNLEYLNLNDTHFSSLDSMQSSNSLTSLQISGCNVKDLSGIQEYRNLEELWISNVKDNDIKYLESLKKLKTLRVTNSELTVVEALKAKLEGVEVY